MSRIGSPYRLRHSSFFLLRCVGCFWDSRGDSVVFWGCRSHGGCTERLEEKERGHRENDPYCAEQNPCTDDFFWMKHKNERIIP